MPYNLTSPNSIIEPVDLHDLVHWFERELSQVPNKSERSVLDVVAKDVDAFVRWPGEALLLWPGCNRIPPEGQRQKYHSYPAPLVALGRSKSVYLDGRPNGPAIAAYLVAGGERPARFGSSNAWSIHHLYSGKFPYHNRQNTVHAAKEGNHFTQSAGLVAVHPVADAMVDEFPFFAWLLRAHAFRRFGYDPDGVFAPQRDEFGFDVARPCCVLVAG